MGDGGTQPPFVPEPAEASSFALPERRPAGFVCPPAAGVQDRLF
jgi:hypothetical protein